jgi:uncharacterized repeat protein (TIGR03803 family)
MTNGSVLRIAKRAMMEALHREHEFFDLFVAYLLARNIRYEEDLVDQLFNSSEKRLARILLLLARFGKEGKHESVVPTDGNLYGTTATGGSYGRGTVFSLSVGLGPFVETQPTSGKVGTAVKILGTDLTGASRVTFNGTAARFKVISKSEIETNVPSGATTGTVEVKTKNTLKSNVVFRVTK